MLKKLMAFRRGLRFSRRYTATATGSNSHPKGPLETYWDGVKEGPGVWKWRHYFPIYERHLAKFVGTDAHIAEVGIFSGGSLPMWRSYFGPQVSIYGIDIEPACRQYEQDGVRVFIGDQSDRGFWRQFRSDVPRLDVLIDDGGHTDEQQIVTLEETLSHLRPGGVYICEDIQAWGAFPEYIAGLQKELHHIEPNTTTATRAAPFQADIASVHVYPYVTVIEKAAATVREFTSERHGTQWQPFL